MLLMKKRLFSYALGFVLLTAFLPGCDLLEDCGTCELTTVKADGTSSSGTPLLFCGDALADKQDSRPVTLGGITTYWDCY